MTPYYFSVQRAIFWTVHNNRHLSNSSVRERVLPAFMRPLIQNMIGPGMWDWSAPVLKVIPNNRQRGYTGSIKPICLPYCCQTPGNVLMNGIILKISTRLRIRFYGSMKAAIPGGRTGNNMPWPGITSMMVAVLFIQHWDIRMHLIRNHFS